MSLPIESAVEVAEGKVSEIYTVQEWADAMNFSSSKYFSRKFRNHFGERPKPKLIKLRVEKFFKLIEEFSEMSCYEIALELGLKDEIALSKFIKRHTGKPPNHWKNINKKKNNK